MPTVRLRPAREADLELLAAALSPEAHPWDWFGFSPSNALHRRFAVDGMISDDSGMLVVETGEKVLVGLVTWRAVRYGPSPACRAWNIGVLLLPDYRNRGYGSAAQRALAEYLFATTLAERVEAGTDVANVAEQRALEKAGFRHEGVLRHAQFRSGHWRDIMLYSILRAEAPPPEPETQPSNP